MVTTARVQIASLLRAIADALHPKPQPRTSPYATTTMSNGTAGQYTIHTPNGIEHWH